jgi:hypothetical protein
VNTTFDTAGPLERIAELLRELSGVRHVYVGVPKAVDEDVAAYVTVGPQAVIDKASGGLLQRVASYYVTFVYAVEGDSQQAEQALASAVDPFLALLYGERSDPDSPLESVTVDLTLSTSAEYVAIVGQEYRRYPVLVNVLQQQTIGVP